MIAYNSIFELADENYGLVTSRMAAEAGISNMALVMLAKRGRLIRVGHGVYRLDQYPTSEYDPYATLLAKAGEGAFLWGPTVLSLDNLCPTDPTKLYVAVPGRIRRALGPGVVIKNGVSNPTPDFPHGLAAQPLPEAIRASRGLIMDGRLKDAARRARSLGMLAPSTYRKLIKELSNVR